MEVEKRSSAVFFSADKLELLMKRFAELVQENRNLKHHIATAAHGSMNDEIAAITALLEAEQLKNRRLEEQILEAKNEVPTSVSELVTENATLIQLAKGTEESYKRQLEIQKKEIEAARELIDSRDLALAQLRGTLDETQKERRALYFSVESMRNDLDEFKSKYRMLEIDLESERRHLEIAAEEKTQIEEDYRRVRSNLENTEARFRQVADPLMDILRCKEPEKIFGRVVKLIKNSVNANENDDSAENRRIEYVMARIPFYEGVLENLERVLLDFSADGAIKVAAAKLVKELTMCVVNPQSFDRLISEIEHSCITDEIVKQINDRMTDAFSMMDREVKRVETQVDKASAAIKSRRRTPKRSPAIEKPPSVREFLMATPSSRPKISPLFTRTPREIPPSSRRPNHVTDITDLI